MSLRIRIVHDSVLYSSCYGAGDLSEKSSKLIVVLIVIYYAPSPFSYQGRCKAEENPLQVLSSLFESFTFKEVKENLIFKALKWKLQYGNWNEFHLNFYWSLFDTHSVKFW